MSDLRERVLRFVSKDSANFPGYLQQGAMAMVWSALETQHELGVTGDIVEIGVYEGKLFALLSLGLREQERAIGIDTFEFSDDSPPTNLARVEQRLIDNGLPAARFELLVCDSAELDHPGFSAAVGTTNIRLFSVDGDHSRAGALHDLLLAAKVTNDQGIIMADDLYNAWYPGVTDAIYDFIRRQSAWVPFLLSSAHGPLHTGCSKLFFCQRKLVGTYRAYFRVQNRDNFLKDAEILSQPIDIYAFNKPIVRCQLNDQRRQEICQLRDSLAVQNPSETLDEGEHGFHNGSLE